MDHLEGAGLQRGDRVDFDRRRSQKEAVRFAAFLTDIHRTLPSLTNSGKSAEGCKLTLAELLDLLFVQAV